MGRARIEIKKIENTSSRQVTFTKRRGGLFKKANELAILCDAEVAIVIFSSTGKLYQFSSSSMERILSRFHTCIESVNNPSTKNKRQKQEPLKQVAVLKEEVEKLKKKQRQLLGKDITGMGLEELRELEQLNEGLLCIKDRKEQILVEQLEESRIQEQRVVLDNETLRKQVEQLQGFCSPSHYPASHYIDSQPTINRNHDFKQGSASPRMACNTALGDADSADINLQLGPPTSGECQERKMSDGVAHSRNTKRQVGSR